MVKKLIQITLFIGLAAVLVVGAINRTQAKSPNVIEGSSGGLFAGNEHEDEYVSGGSSQQGVGKGSVPKNQSNLGSTFENADSSGSQTQNVDLFTVITTVDTVSSDNLQLVGNDGEIYKIEGRAWLYLLDQGFLPEVGSQILLTGYYDLENYYKAAQLVNNVTNDQVAIRDETGRPVWAGTND